MSDLISRQAAIDEFEKELSANTGREFGIGFGGIKRILQALPFAEPQIIRCKDCKYYGRVDKRRFYRGVDCLNNHIDTIVPDKDFCSRAKRRTDETDYRKE